MWLIPSFMLVWFMWEKLIQAASGKRFSQKWSSNLVSATHSVVTVAECWLALQDELDPAVIFVVSTSYFVYDIRNYPAGTVYFIHHICSILALTYGINCGPDTGMALTCFLFTEIGNFPVYVMYCLFTHPNKDYLNRWHDVILVWEFVWFVVFRILVVSWVLSSAVHPISIFLGTALQAANIKWASGMYSKVRNSFKPINVSERFS